VSLSLGDRTVGSGTTLVVAEIGSNHDGDLERALALIDAAAAAGAGAVQFHSFRAARASGVHDRADAEAQAHRARVELRTEGSAPARTRVAASSSSRRRSTRSATRPRRARRAGVLFVAWRSRRTTLCARWAASGGRCCSASPARAAARSTPRSSRSGRAPARRRAVRPSCW
jgi:hypothetical protein